MSQNSVSLHRVLKTTPEKVYRAFSDKDAYASWIPPYGFICIVDYMDFRKGGTFKMQFKNFTTGSINSFGGTILELKPNEFIKYNDKFDDPNLLGEIETSIWITKVSCGTELKIHQTGIPPIIPIELCYLGWQESLEKLIKLVEPEIQEG